MAKNIALYGLSAVIVAAFAALAGWGESKFPSETLRADVVREQDFAREKIAFMTDFEKTVEKAQEEKKPVLVFFMTKNCPYSANMLSSAFEDPRVERLAKEFVCVMIDIGDPQYDELCNSYNVDASPTVQFTTANGELLQRLVAEQSGDRLAEQMKAALTSVAWRTARAESRGGLLK